MNIVGMRLWVKTACIAVLIAVILAPMAEAGWVWTPETGWMNAKQTPKATAKEQFEDASVFYEKASTIGLVPPFPWSDGSIPIQSSPKRRIFWRPTVCFGRSTTRGLTSGSNSF